MNALKTLTVLAFTFASAAGAWAASPHVGVGAKPEKGAQVLFDGSKEMLHSKWTYWKGPGFKSSLPIKWPIVEDPAPTQLLGMLMSRGRRVGVHRRPVSQQHQCSLRKITHNKA